MKSLYFLILLIFFSLQVNAQELDENTFKFWVGQWDLTWRDTNGNVSRGSNLIESILDDKVIQEHFEGLEGQYQGFKGTSISVFNPTTKSWHQTWQDNQGGNIVLTGRVEGNRKIFETAMTEEGRQSRMVFHSFTEDGFIWDWEATADGGNTWQLSWQINYTKAK